MVTDTRGPWKRPTPALRTRRGRGARCGRLPHSWCPPSSPSPARTGKMSPTQGGWAFTRTHWSGLLAREVLHTLKKQENEMGWCLERTNDFVIPILEIEAQQLRWCSYCSRPRAFSRLSVGVEGPASSILEVKPKAGVYVCVCVFLRPREFLEIVVPMRTESLYGSPVFLLPSKVTKQKENKT